MPLNSVSFFVSPGRLLCLSIKGKHLSKKSLLKRTRSQEFETRQTRCCRLGIRAFQLCFAEPGRNGPERTRKHYQRKQTRGRYSGAKRFNAGRSCASWVSTGSRENFWLQGFCQAVSGGPGISGQSQPGQGGTALENFDRAASHCRVTGR